MLIHTSRRQLYSSFEICLQRILPDTRRIAGAACRGYFRFEVKAHECDPGYVELERSRVAARVAVAGERNGTWSIYVVHVTALEASFTGL
ncbi:Molecular chaperone of HSP90 family (plasmid) [Mesorhizobium loti]|nr:Molecular chaperone of HSP90 family [Mesorhizobium loti]